MGTQQINNYKYHACICVMVTHVMSLLAEIVCAFAKIILYIFLYSKSLSQTVGQGGMLQQCLNFHISHKYVVGIAICNFKDATVV